jgi:hypothetical protein
VLRLNVSFILSPAYAMSRKANPKGNAKQAGDKPEKVLEQLFTWAKSVVTGYPGVNLTNWEKSWQNGYGSI